MSSYRYLRLNARRIRVWFRTSPEGTAFEKIEAFVEENQLLEEGKLPGTFGFNNPDPSQGGPNYGYEIWLPVAEDM